MTYANGQQGRSPRWLHKLSTSEVGDYLRDSDTVVVPCGATEQHGDHLPVGVDALTAIAVSEAASAKTGVLLTPPLWFGWSPHHMGFPGTVSLRAETLTFVAEDIALSLVHHGFKRIVFVNGHRLANLPPLAIATSRVRNQTGAVVVVADLAHLAQPAYADAAENHGAAGIGHADGYETAHMMHIHPELVALDRIADSVSKTRQVPGTHPSMRTIDPSKASSRAGWWPSTEDELIAGGSGVSGDPTWGSEERGAKLHRAMVEDLLTLLDQVKSAPVDIQRPPSPC